MKILYVANERGTAQGAAHALRRIARNITLVWARTPGAALDWIRGNRDASAVLVDPVTQNPGCNTFLQQVRGLGVDTPVAVIAPDHLDGLVAALDARIHAEVVQERRRRIAVEAELKDVEAWREQAVQRLAERQAEQETSLSRTTRICTALQDRLLELEAALHRADERHTAETAATRQLLRRETELRAAVEEAVAARTGVERRLADADAALHREQQIAAQEIEAARERHSALEHQLTHETTARTTLEERLAGVEIARQDADGKHAAELTSLTSRFADRESQHNATQARTNRICTTLQGRLLELEAALGAAGDRRAADAAALQQLTAREGELTASLTEAAAARAAVDRRLAETEAAHRHEQDRAAAALSAAATRHAALGERLHQEIEARTTLEARLTDADRSRQQAAQQHATELATQAARLGDVQAQYAAALEQMASLERQATEGAATFDQARREWQSELAEAAAQRARREAELGAALAEAEHARSSAEKVLGDAQAAHEHDRQRAAADLTAASERSAALDHRLTEEIAARTTLEARLIDVERAREQAAQRYATELAALAARLGDAQAQYAEALERVASLERQVADGASALEQTRREWQSELAEATAQLVRREAELGAAVAEAVAARSSAEKVLAEAQAAHEHERQCAAADLAAAAERAAALDRRLTEEIDARTLLEARLAEAEAVHQSAVQQHAMEAASLNARLADVQSRHAAAMEQTASVERQLADTAAALDQTRRDWTTDITAAAERQVGLETQLAGEASRGVVLEQRLAAAETGRDEALRRHAEESASLTAQLTGLQVRYDEAMRQSAAFEQQLGHTSSVLENVRREWQAEVAAVAGQLAQRETELGQALSVAIAAGVAVEDRLAAAEADRDQARQRAAADLALAAERHAALEAEAGRERASARSLQDALSQLEVSMRLALEARGRDIAQLQLEADGLRRQIEAMRTRAAALRRDAERVPALQLQLEASQKENRRQFERAPYGLCECTRDGAITRANHSFARLLGYRSIAELEGPKVVSAIFENAGDLNWLLERVESTGKMQSVETTLTTRDGRRLSVRLHALTTDGVVVIAVEDLTRLSAVEQRLREAQRLEAVGRVASEVAVTCDMLLHDVTQGGRQWLAALEDDATARHRGELLLGDVTRAAGYLQQFVAYGHRELSNLEPVSVRQLLREMEPVLKRVLGGDIILILSRATDACEVDVDAERVERILVTVANYARERLPHGGRVRIQLATTVVDQRLLARHPTVRPGPHVLITISELQGAVWPAIPADLAITRPTPTNVSRPSGHPGMDLGPLMALISDAGGHLWLAAEPAGNMTVQIHLPKRVLEETTEPAGAASWSNRGRQLARWFRN